MSVLDKIERTILPLKKVALINKNYLKITFDGEDEAKTFFDDVSPRIKNLNTDLNVDVSLKVGGKDNKIVIFEGMTDLFVRDQEKFTAILKRIESSKEGTTETAKDILKRALEKEGPKEDEEDATKIDVTTIGSFLDKYFKSESVDTLSNLTSIIARKYKMTEKDARTEIDKWLKEALKAKHVTFDEASDIVTWRE